MTEEDKFLLDIIKETLDADEVVNILEIDVDTLVDILQDIILDSDKFSFYREMYNNDV